MNLVGLPHSSQYTHLSTRELEASSKSCPSCKFISRQILSVTRSETSLDNADIYQDEGEESIADWVNIFSIQEAGPPSDRKNRPSTVIIPSHSSRLTYKIYDYPKEREDFQIDFEIFVPR